MLHEDRTKRERNGEKNIVVIGASAGHRCPESLVAELPAGVDASLFVVQHTGADNPGLLPAILELPGSRLLRVNSAAPG